MLTSDTVLPVCSWGDVLTDAAFSRPYPYFGVLIFVLFIITTTMLLLQLLAVAVTSQFSAAVHSSEESEKRAAKLAL